MKRVASPMCKPANCHGAGVNYKVRSCHSPITLFNKPRRQACTSTAFSSQECSSTSCMTCLFIHGCAYVFAQPAAPSHGSWLADSRAEFMARPIGDSEETMVANIDGFRYNMPCSILVQVSSPVFRVLIATESFLL